MNSFTITNVRVLPLMFSLSEGFEVSFGVFHSLARIIVDITAVQNNRVVHGLGEASIDFPFSHYDAWDIYDELSELNLIGQDVHSRQNLVFELAEQLKPASLCAINQALDDVEAKLRDIHPSSLYSQIRFQAQPMQSIGISEDPATLRSNVIRVIGKGRIPKIKLGRCPAYDVAQLISLESQARDMNFQYMVDFNAAYSPEEISAICSQLPKKAIQHAIGIEQPTTYEAGVDGLAAAKSEFHRLNPSAVIIADESFVTENDAKMCTNHGIGLNYKLQKVGGLIIAKRIEARLIALHDQCPPSMIGGTFPSAIGREYDMLAASVMSSAHLPADGALPASTYFTGVNDLAITSEHITSPVEGGFSLRLDTHKLMQLAITDFRHLYSLIRKDAISPSLHFDLRGKSYADLYFKQTGRPVTWNLQEAA